MIDEFREELEKTRTLLASPDLDYVKTGLELGTNLCMIVPELGKELIGPISLNKEILQVSSSFQEWPHIHYIVLWILGASLIDGQPTYFKHLNLSDSNLTELPDDLSGIQLKSIDLSQNELPHFPFQLLEMEGLRHIDLRPKRGSWRRPSVEISISKEEMLLISQWIMDDRFCSDLELNSKKNILINDQFDKRLQSQRLTGMCNQAERDHALISRVDYINFSWYALSEVPQNLMVFSRISMIDLPTDIDDQAAQHLFPLLAQLPKLRTVIYKKSSIHDSIISEQIGMLKQVTTLKIERCKVNTLPKGIGNMSNLEHLTITYNRISSLPDSMKNLKRLRIIEAQNNHFNTFPIVIDSLRNLEEADFSCCKIRTLSLTFTLLNKLRYLNLSNNRIFSIPVDIGNATAMSHLVLSNNKLRDLPDSISSLSNLTRFRVRGNPLQSMPNNLRILAIDGKQWEQFQEQILTMTTLESLLLDNIDLQELPDSMKNLVNLQFLSLKNNPIKELPKWLETLPKLERIHCQRTLIKYFDLPFDFRLKVHIRDNT